MRTALLIPALLLAAPIAAQSTAPADQRASTGTLLSQLGGGQAGGLLGSLGGQDGGLLGNLGGSLGGAGIGNVTGLLGYCVKNQLLGGVAGASPTAGGAGSLLGRLTGRLGVTDSAGYAAGQQGLLQSNGRSLALGSLGGGVKQQLCRAVMGRAQGLLGR